MKIGLSIPNNWGVEDGPSLIDLAVRAEHHGFSSVWTSEHLINLDYVRARIGDRPYYHPLAVLSAIASRTTTIALGTSVIVLPFHNPFDLAKYIATLDQLSCGRVILGVGVGNVEEEFVALGIPWRKRGAITDESIRVMQALWTQDEATHQGAFWQFQDIHTSPKPYRGRQMPLWIGGMSEAALQRVANYADGWHPTGVAPGELHAMTEKLDAYMAAQGRDPSKLEICMRFNIALDDVTVTATELRSTVKRGDTARMVQIASEYAEVGVTHFIYALNGSDPDIIMETIDVLASELLTRFPA